MCKKHVLLAGLCAATLAIDASAANYQINFNAALNPYARAPELGYLYNSSGQQVTGSMLIDADLAGPDTLPAAKNQQRFYSENNWIVTTFDPAIPFSYAHPDAPGRQFDNFYINTQYRDYDSLRITDFFTSDDRGRCAGVIRPAEYCWMVQLDLKVEKGLVKWNEPLSLTKDNILDGSRLITRLVNYDPAYGFVSGNNYHAMGLTDFSLATVAPVPLPAGVWLFLTAMTSFLAVSRRRNS